MTVGAFVLVLGGAVYREINFTYVEFSPNGLRLRQRHDPSIPFLRFPLRGPTIGRPYRTELMQYLVHQGYFHPDDERRLWVGNGTNLPKKGPQTDCGLLIEQLSDDTWIRWSERNPDQATLLWSQLEHSLKEKPYWDGIWEAEELLLLAESARENPDRLRRVLSNRESRNAEEPAEETPK